MRGMLLVIVSAITRREQVRSIRTAERNGEKDCTTIRPVLTAFGGERFCLEALSLTACRLLCVEGGEQFRAQHH